MLARAARENSPWTGLLWITADYVVSVTGGQRCRG